VKVTIDWESSGEVSQLLFVASGIFATCFVLLLIFLYSRRL